MSSNCSHYFNPDPVKQPAGGRLQCWIDRGLALAWIAAAVMFVAAAARDSIVRVPFRGWTSMWESAPLAVVANAAQGDRIYGNWHNGPVHLAIYGPLYYQMLGWLAAQSGGDASDIIVLARWWGLICGGIGLLGVTLFIRSRSGPWWAMLIGLACAGLLAPTALRFIASARPDSMAAALAVLGLTAGLSHRRIVMAAGVVLLSLAWLTKVTALAAVLTVILSLACQRRWRRLAWFAAGYALLTAGSVAVLQMATGGWFLRHLNVASAAPTRVAYIWQMLTHRPRESETQFLFVYPALAILTLVFLHLTHRQRRRTRAAGATPKPQTPADDASSALPIPAMVCSSHADDPTLSAPATNAGSNPRQKPSVAPEELADISGCLPFRTEPEEARLRLVGFYQACGYFALSAAVALLTAMRQGSDRNYLIEPIFAAGTVMGMWAAYVATLRNRRPWVWTRLAAGLALVNPLLMRLPDRFADSIEQRRMEMDIMSPYQDEALSWVRRLPQPLLSIDSWLPFRAGAANDLNDPIAYTSLVLAGGIDPVTQRVRAGRYACIVLMSPVENNAYAIYGDLPCDWPALRQTMRERYRLLSREGTWYAYVPKE